jgi:hypothetical protein
VGTLKNDITELVECSHARGVDGAKIAKRLIEAGLRMMAAEGEMTEDNRIAISDCDTGEFYITKFVQVPETPTYTQGLIYAGPGEKNIPVERLPEMLAAIRFAGELFDGYARHHISKGDEPRRGIKAQRNIEAATKMFKALDDDYTPPEVPESGIVGEDDWKLAVRADSSPVGADSPTKAAGSARKLLSDLHIAEIAGDPLLGVQIHLDDQPVLNALVELRFLNRDDVSDKVTLTTVGKDALGVRPDGVPELPVEAAEITGNVEERELAGRYIDAKIVGVEKWIAEHPSEIAKHDYEIMARVLTEIAHEFRIGLHIPAPSIHGRVIPYNEDRSTGVSHSAALRLFFEDCYSRNLRAGWWTNIEDGTPKKRSVGELFILFVTEIAEAYRAWINREADDKLPEYPGLGVELADLGIRWADFCGAYLAGNIIDADPANNPGDQMFLEIVAIAERYEAIRKTPEATGEPETADLLPSADVAIMVDAKLAFNATRADHKIENRLLEDGKRT